MCQLCCRFLLRVWCLQSVHCSAGARQLVRWQSSPRQLCCHVQILITELPSPQPGWWCRHLELCSEATQSGEARKLPALHFTKAPLTLTSCVHQQHLQIIHANLSFCNARPSFASQLGCKDAGKPPLTSNLVLPQEWLCVFEPFIPKSRKISPLKKGEC